MNKSLYVESQCRAYSTDVFSVELLKYSRLSRIVQTAEKCVAMIKLVGKSSSPLNGSLANNLDARTGRVNASPSPSDGSCG